MQFFISVEEGGKIYIYIKLRQETKNTSSVSVTFVQHLDECSLDLAHISVIPIYHIFSIIFYWEHIPDARENECGDVFYLYIKLFGVKIDGFCSMEPSGNLLATCLKYGWFLVMCFVCQFVYHETPIVLWRTENNIIEFFS
jgi:hypothetical protein